MFVTVGNHPHPFSVHVVQGEGELTPSPSSRKDRYQSVHSVPWHPGLSCYFTKGHVIQARPMRPNPGTFSGTPGKEVLASHWGCIGAGMSTSCCGQTSCHYKGSDFWRMEPLCACELALLPQRKKKKKERKPWFAAFASFHDINTPTMANFMLPMI